MSTKNVNRPGYKPTEIGWIPKEWECAKLGDLFEEKNEFTSDIKECPLYSLTIEGGVVPKTERYERSFLLKNKEGNQYKKVSLGEIVFNPMNLRFGAIGLSAVPHDVTVSAYYNIIAPQKNVDARYYIKLLQSRRMINRYDTIAIGSLIEKRRVHWSILKEQSVPLPSFPEQRRIAEILSTWDRAIDQTRRLLEACKRRKQGLMQKLLTGTWRFPEFGEPATNGELPGGWKTIEIGMICIIVSGSTPSTAKDEYWNGTIKWVTPAEISDTDILISDTERHLTEQGMRAARLRLMPKGTILLTSRAPIGKIAIANAEMACNQGFKNLVCMNDIFNYFLFYSLKRKKEYIESLGRGGTFKEITKDIVSKIKILLPPFPEQEQIASILTVADAEITTLQKSFEKLQLQKRGLMQKLLTGEIRV